MTADPPAADREALVEWLAQFVGAPRQVVVAAFDEGVLVDAADVKAQALEDAAEELFYDGDTDRPLPGYAELLDRAVSERGRGTT